MTLFDLVIVDEACEGTLLGGHDLKHWLFRVEVRKHKDNRRSFDSLRSAPVAQDDNPLSIL